MRCFHKRALDCYDPTVKDVLFDVYLHGMMEEYYIHLKNLPFASFSRLMEAATMTNHCIRRIMRSNATVMRNLKKQPLVVAVDKSGGSQGSSRKREQIAKSGMRPGVFLLSNRFPMDKG